MPRKNSRLTPPLATKEQAVVELRTAGYGWERIAAESGYANAGGAWKAYHRALKRIPQQAVEEHRETQHARILALLRATWDRATDPDAKGQLFAVDRAVALLEREADLLGLDAPAKVAQTDASGKDIPQLAISIIDGRGATPPDG